MTGFPHYPPAPSPPFSSKKSSCVTRNLETQPLKGVSCTENCCCYTLEKFLGNYSFTH